MVDMTKYKFATNKSEWHKIVNELVSKYYLKSNPELDTQEQTISYESRGIVLAVWDIFEGRGWIVTEEYFKTGTVEHKRSSSDR